MPYEIQDVAATEPRYQEPFIGDILSPVQIKVDVSTLTTDEVDAKGRIKPGVALGKDGKRLTGVAGEYVFGVVPEPSKVAAMNPTNVTLAAQTQDYFVAVVRIGVLDRDAAEANLGRVLSAEEIVGFEAAGCKLALSRI